MSAWKYKRLTPKVIVSKLRLIDPAKLVDMSTKSLDAISSILTETAYQPDILNLSSPLDSLSLEHALISNFMRTYDEIADYSQREIRSLLLALMMKFEANIVKSMLRAKEANMSVDEALAYIIPVGRLSKADCRKKLEKSRSVKDMAEAFSDMEYGYVLKKALGENLEIRPLRRLESALDKYVYDGIWKAAAKLRGLDGKIARTVLGIEIDFLNVKVILRCKAMGISDQQIRRYLVPSSEVFAERDFENAMKAGDVKEIIENLLTTAKLAMARDHQYTLNSLLKEYENTHSFSCLGLLVDQGLLKASLRMVKRYTPFFNIGSVLAFLNLKWFEIRNLRAIFRGIECNIPPHRIKKFLILPE